MNIFGFCKWIEGYKGRINEKENLNVLLLDPTYYKRLTDVKLLFVWHEPYCELWGVRQVNKNHGDVCLLL